MPPTLTALPDDTLDGRFRLTLGFALLTLVPLVAAFGTLGVMEGYIEIPLPPQGLPFLPELATLALASLVLAPLTTMIRVVAQDQFRRQLARLGDEPAIRRELLDALRRELRERAGGPRLRALLGVTPEVWSEAHGELALAIAPVPLTQFPTPGADPDDVWLNVTTRRGRPKINVIWRLRRAANGRWQVVDQLEPATYLRGRVLAALQPPAGPGSPP